MAKKKPPDTKGVKFFPPPPKDFDALEASPKELARHGIPQRPDPRTQPVLAALWEQYAHRYQRFEHLKPKLIPAKKSKQPVASGLGLSPLIHCGFEMFSSIGAITQFSGTWTIPNLNNSPNGGLANDFRTFFGLGLLDLHVEMEVDPSHNVTIEMKIQTGDVIAIPIRPGDVVSATLCLQTNSAGTAFFGLANETTSQTMSFTIDTEFPPAVRINAGIARGSQFGNGPPDPLARFGVIYFDELRAFTANGTSLHLTDGAPTTMTASNGSTLATPHRINPHLFKTIYRGP